MLYNSLMYVNALTLCSALNPWNQKRRLKSEMKKYVSISFLSQTQQTLNSVAETDMLSIIMVKNWLNNAFFILKNMMILILLWIKYLPPPFKKPDNSKFASRDVMWPHRIPFCLKTHLHSHTYSWNVQRKYFFTDNSFTYYRKISGCSCQLPPNSWKNVSAACVSCQTPQCQLTLQWSEPVVSQK